MNYDYKVVPFIGQSKGTLSASDVAAQLENAIRYHASIGWEFCQLSDVNVEVQPGCLAGLFGAQVQYVRFDQIIFRSKDGGGGITLANGPGNSAESTNRPAPEPPRAPTSDWSCRCGQRNPATTSACLECGMPY